MQLKKKREKAKLKGNNPNSYACAKVYNYLN